MQKILITGAAGFIGSHMALALKNLGVPVIGLDNFNDYYSVELKKKRASLLLERKIPVIQGDLCDEKLLENLFAETPFTHVLNLAAQAGVRYARENPQAYIKSNIQGFFTLLEQLKKRPEIKLVYASSSSVYGCNDKVPFSTEDPTEKPANLYAATKKSNELLAYSYHHLYGIQTIGLRYFTVYGPWGRPDMAYYSFTNAILHDQPIYLFNQGKMWRDFTYIDDAVQGTLAALNYDQSAIFNIGNHKTEKLLTLVSILEDLLGKKAEKIFVEESPGEMETTFADISDTQKKLSFEPKVSLQEGLHHFISWYRENASGKASIISEAIRE